MHAIPTMYAGVQFRSRLEARWAAFFDEIGWRWSYEPLDLDGYIPDFIVEYGQLYGIPWNHSGGPEGWLVSPSTGMTGTRIVRRLVEVKPALEALDLLAATAKIDASGWDGEASVVGAQLWDHPSGGLEIGTLRYGAAPRWGWGSWFMRGRRATIAAWCAAGNRVQWRAPELEAA